MVDDFPYHQLICSVQSLETHQIVFVWVRLNPKSLVRLGPKIGKQKIEPAVREVAKMQLEVMKISRLVKPLASRLSEFIFY